MDELGQSFLSPVQAHDGHHTKPDVLAEHGEESQQNLLRVRPLVARFGHLSATPINRQGIE